MILWMATACYTISARLVGGGVDTVAKAVWTASVGGPMPNHGLDMIEVRL
jgi:hypothetical protein